MNIFSSRQKIIFAFLFFQFSQLSAQKVEIGGLIGASYYWGDIVNNIEPSNSRFAASAFVRYHYSERISARANFAYARIRGSDSISRGSVWQINRNLAFWTDVFELSGIVEYNLLPDNNIGRKVKRRMIPYVFGGLGAFYFNPKAYNPITGKEVELQPLQLNGESYSRVSICVPLGIGFRYYVSRRWQIGLEFGARYSFSSYIDDVAGKSTYPALEQLKSDDARIMYCPTVARLAQIRASESTYVAGPTGKERGKNELVSDIYFIGGVTVSYRLWPGQNIRCPRVY